MANIPGVDAVRSKEIRLEWENTEQLVDVLLHGGQTALPPGPNLRRYQIDHGNSQALQTPRQPQMEIRAIGQDGDIWALHFRGVDQLPILAINARDMRDNFHQTHYGDASRIHHGANRSEER